MSQSSRFRSTIVASIAVLAVLMAAESSAQHSNPYRAYYGWAKLPEGREWGAISAIYPANDGKHIWIAER